MTRLPRDFKPLSAEEAQRLREAHPALSPWWVIAAQVVAGGLVSVLAWAWVGWNGAVSALYGALVVALPAAVFARGLRRGAGGVAQAAVLGFAVWEFAKLALSVAMLGVAPWLFGGVLHWLALLAGVVAAMKMYWVALLVRPRLLKRN